MSGKFDMADYVEVSERIALFREKHPEGSLQAEVLRWPEEGFPFVAVKAWAYRSPGDERPGEGLAIESFPGKTPYTKDSELQNAETSAWGRAIVAALAADTKSGIASADEIRSRAGSEGRSASSSRGRSTSKPSTPRVTSGEGLKEAGDGEAPASSPSPDTEQRLLDALRAAYPDDMEAQRGHMKNVYGRLGVPGWKEMTPEQVAEVLEELNK